MENEVMEAIYSRRSIRSYEDKKVPRETIEKLLNAAVMAPSARNEQPWNFTVITNRAKINELGDKAAELRGMIGKGIKVGLKLAGRGTIFYNAPLLIVISGKADYKYLKDDTNLAVQNLFLAAHSLGLGSCWIGMAKVLNDDDWARKELGVQEGFDIVAPLIFGFPAEKKTAPERKPKILKWIE